MWPCRLGAPLPSTTLRPGHCETPVASPSGPTPGRELTSCVCKAGGGEGRDVETPGGTPASVQTPSERPF